MNKNIETRNLSPGMYFITVQFMDHSITSTKIFKY